MKLIIIGIILLVWIIAGFYAFIWYAKLERVSEFNSVAKSDLAICVLLGLIALGVVICIVVANKFNNFMNNLLKKNSK